jgi:hypothetical protein
MLSVLLNSQHHSAGGRYRSPMVSGMQSWVNAAGFGQNNNGSAIRIDEAGSASDTATISPVWTTIPDVSSTYIVEGDRLGSNNYIYITTSSITGRNINLDPTGWDKHSNLIVVNGVRVLGSITGATNANPIVITSAGHELRDGELVTIDDVEGNTNANGSYYVDELSTSTFALYTNEGLTTGRAGNGVYTTNTGYFGKRFNSVDAAGN